MKFRLPHRRIASACALSTALAGCSGGGSDPAPPGPVTGGVTLTGVVSVGQPVTSAAVKVSALDSTTGTKAATPMASVTTNPDGTYSITITNGYTGAVLVEANNVVFNDVASGDNVTGQTLRAGVQVGSATAPTAAITPLTEIAVRKVETSDGRVVPSQVLAANTLVAETLLGSGRDIIGTKPANVTTAAGTTVEKEYGLVLAAIAQASSTSRVALATTIGQIAADLKDNGAIDLTGASVNEGLTTFVASGTNQTGVTLDSTTVDTTIATSSTPPVTTTIYRYAQAFDLFWGDGNNQVAAADGRIAFNSDATGAIVVTEPGWERTGGTVAALSSTDGSGSGNMTWATAGATDRTITDPDGSTISLTFSDDGRHFTRSELTTNGVNLMFGAKVATSGYTQGDLTGTYRGIFYAPSLQDDDENGSYTVKVGVQLVDQVTFNGDGTCAYVEFSTSFPVWVTGASGFSIPAAIAEPQMTLPSCTYTVSDAGKVTIDGDPVGWISEDRKTLFHARAEEDDEAGSPAVSEFKNPFLTLWTKNPDSYAGVTPSGKTYMWKRIGTVTKPGRETLLGGSVRLAFTATSVTVTPIDANELDRQYNGSYSPPVLVLDTVTGGTFSWGYDANANNVIDAGEVGTVSSTGLTHMDWGGFLVGTFLNDDASVLYHVDSTAIPGTTAEAWVALAIRIQ